MVIDNHIDIRERTPFYNVSSFVEKRTREDEIPNATATCKKRCCNGVPLLPGPSVPVSGPERSSNGECSTANVRSISDDTWRRSSPSAEEKQSEKQSSPSADEKQSSSRRRCLKSKRGHRHRRHRSSSSDSSENE